LIETTVESLTPVRTLTTTLQESALTPGKTLGHCSGVSRVWQAWHVPWAQLSGGRKNCLAQHKFLFTVF